MKRIYRNLIVLAAALVLPLNVFADGDKGIVLSKKVNDKGDGSYTITLETYTTGQTVKTSGVAPTDFVLLLDWSSSMTSNITITTETKVTGTLSSNTTYHYYTDSSHSTMYYLKRVRHDNGRWADPRYSYKWAYSTNEDFTYDNVPDSNVLATTAEFSNGSGLEIYSTSTSTISRQRALQNAVCSFLDSVESQNPGEDKYHRVSIVWYGAGIKASKYLADLETGNGNDYNFYDLTPARNTGLKNSIKGANNANNDTNGLTTTGTYSHQAFEKAVEIVNYANPDGRDRVVVFFTDGEPGNMTGRFVDEYARSAVDYATEIKAVQTSKAGVTPVKYAKIFAVGLMTSGTADDHYYTANGRSQGTVSNDKYRFMHYVSSNYGLTGNVDSNYHFGSDLTNATNVNTEAGSGTTSPWGYFKKTDGSDLEAIFESIANENASTNKDINEESAVVLDALTNMFKIPSGTTADDIRLYTCAAKTDRTTLVWEDTGSYVVKKDDRNIILADDASSYDHLEAWVAWEPWKDSAIKTEKKEGETTLKYDFNGDGTVTVSDFIWLNNGVTGVDTGTDFLEVMGFDYASNFVGPKVENGVTTGYQGKKLIIQFDIQIDEANTGGINLNTNDEDSGVYIKTGDDDYEVIEYFESPCVYLPYVRITKTGLSVGESAIFTVTKVTGNNSTTEPDSDKFSAKVILVKTDANADPEAVVKLRHPGWYKITETSWSWAYNPDAASKWGELVTAESVIPEDQQVYLEFEFENTLKSEDLPEMSAEAAVRNNMTSATHTAVSTVDTNNNN